LTLGQLHLASPAAARPQSTAWISAQHLQQLFSYRAMYDAPRTVACPRLLGHRMFSNVLWGRGTLYEVLLSTPEPL
jgi:hypothetical protein